MGEIERLIRAFGARGKANQPAWKLDVLLDLGRIDDPRVVAFLMDIVNDAEEPTDVRIDALKRLREAPLTPGERSSVATVGLRVLQGQTGPALLLHAALVLGDFVDIDGVLDALGAVARDDEEPLELRYNAFTALQRAGPTPESLALLRGLSGDETLGPSARALIIAWGGE